MDNNYVEQGTDRIDRMYAAAEAYREGGLEDGSYNDPDDIFFHIDVCRQATFWFTMGGPNIFVEVEYNDEGILRATATASTDRTPVTEAVREDSALWNLLSEYVDTLIE